MTHLELFRHLGPILAPHLENVMHRRDLCIAATRIAIRVGEYFGVEVRAQACRVLIVNKQFAKHLADAHERGVDWVDVDIKTFAALDGSHSVGIGWPGEHNRNHPWPLHLVAAGGGYVADFSIWQAERPDKNIKTGSAIIAPISPRFTCVEKETGTEVRYWMVNHQGYRQAPDWKHHRTSRLAGPVIRHIRALEHERESINEIIHERIG